MRPLSFIQLCDILHLIREISPRRRRRQWLAIFVILFNGFVNYLAKLDEHLLLIIAMTTAIEKTWGTSHVAVVLI